MSTTEQIARLQADIGSRKRVAGLNWYALRRLLQKEKLALTKEIPLGFVAVDVDCYSAAKAAMAILEGAPENYLPLVPVYLDDIGVVGSNPWNGELLAVSESNAENTLRKIAPFMLLRSRRIFKNTQWIDRMYAVHIHDHPYCSPELKRATKRVIANEYLG
jgi:hypothetical protein